MAERKRIAAIVTAYFPAAHGSHADLVVSKFARGFPTSDGVIEPKVDLVSMYVDQPHWTGMETGAGERVRHRASPEHPRRPDHDTAGNDRGTGLLRMTNGQAIWRWMES